VAEADPDLHDALLTRFTLRNPDDLCYTLDDDDDDRFCAQGLVLDPQNEGVWRDIGYRKWRVDLMGTAFRHRTDTRDCKDDDILLQDALFFGQREVKDIAFGVEFEEMLESDTSCSYDRIAIVTEFLGQPTMFRAHGNVDPTPKWVTSIVTFGHPLDAGSLIAHFSSIGLTLVGNYAVDGGMKSYLTPHYGVRMDYFPGPGSPGLTSFKSCLSNIGMYAVGYSWANTATVADCEDVPGLTRIEILDTYFANIGGPARQLFQIPTSGTLPPEGVVFENNLFHWADGATWKSLYRHTSTPPIPATVNHTTLLSGGAAADDRLRFIDSAPAGTSVGQIQVGPNLYTSGATDTVENTVAFQSTTGAIVADAIAPGGDGVARTGWTRGLIWAGEPSAGELLEVTGLTGSLPAACTNASSPDSAAVESCDQAEAMPRWSGPVVYDWPFAWATLEPVPGFRRTAPREEYLPDYLYARIAPAPECNDGVDNDDDGVVDYPADPGCDDSADLSERSPFLPCDDGEDNDDDGFVDFVPDGDGDGIPDGDPGCGWPSSIENPQCQDGINNDLQAGIDFDGGVSIWGAQIDLPDPNCAKPWSRESAGCGLGFELALLILPLLRLHRKRREAWA
jgi:hypothetical protein